MTEVSLGGRVSGHEAAAVRTEIERRLAAHAEALAAGDVDRCLELYTSDAVVRPANMEPGGAWRYHRGIFNSSLPADETITSKEE